MAAVSTVLCSSAFRSPPPHPLLPPIASRLRSPPRASRRFPNYSPETVVVVPDPRAWREIGSFEERECDSDGDEDEEDESRSLDLLVRVLHNVFLKISRRVRRAARAVLPVAIPARLVKFSVNGILILTFLWILKALLEVMCTFGSIVFASILLVRGIWSTILYIHESRFSRRNRYGDDNNAWRGAQAAM